MALEVHTHSLISRRGTDAAGIVFLSNVWNGIDLGSSAASSHGSRRLSMVIRSIHIYFQRIPHLAAYRHHASANRVLLGIAQCPRVRRHRSLPSTGSTGHQQESHHPRSACALLMHVVAKNSFMIYAGLMFSQFMFILLVAVWCFFGFAVALYLLAAGEFSMAYIGKVRF